ncbi:MAG: hypothetical protein V1738_01400 [Patescibacteria group bacterium]
MTKEVQLARRRKYGEIHDLIKLAESIPPEEFIEPSNDLEPTEIFIGTVNDLDIKRLYTLMIHLEQQLDDFSSQVLYRGGPDKMSEEQVAAAQRASAQCDAVRELFFMTLFFRFPSLNASHFGIAKNWQVFRKEFVPTEP